MTDLSKSALAMWDFTIPTDKCPDLGHIIKTLNEWAKKWAFQKEFAPTKDEYGVVIDPKVGYEHWQGRLSLIKKHRGNEMIAIFKELLPGVHWGPTNNVVHKGQTFNYVMKADTRIDGPWNDFECPEPPPLTRQLKAFQELDMYPWQKQVELMVTEEDDRSIKLVIDEIGNAGKSIFAEYLEYEGKAWEIPPFRLMEDIMQCVMSIKNQKAYLVDMPRAMKKDKLSEFYSGLEALKNGVCYDKRYGFKKRRMDRPQVIVFTNKEPCWEYMSLDRWEIWIMGSDKALSTKKP